MKSCIYEGQVRHSRTTPVMHRFKYKMFMMYLDLDELPALFDAYCCWSARRWSIARFKRSDHLGPENEPLAESVRKLVEAETGLRPAGPIRLLTNLRYFGYCFNPVSFYYCFANDGQAPGVLQRHRIWRVRRIWRVVYTWLLGVFGACGAREDSVEEP